MARYGGDYTSGRYARWNPGDTGYDVEYGGGRGPGGYDRERAWGGSERSHHPGQFDESWGSMGHGGGRRGPAGAGWGDAGRFRGYADDPGRFGGYADDAGRFGGYWEGQGRFRGYADDPDRVGGYGAGSGRFGGYGGGRIDRVRSGEWEGMNRGHYDRETRRGSRIGNDYDEQFGDRIRRGWNRLRDEARGWMGRGYDRGW